MGKSFWFDEEQKGNFSNDKNDTFDDKKHYIGVRIQQGVPLLDRDWNESEDIRRHQELSIRKYLGDGTPDNGFMISALATAGNDFVISAGRYLVDGFEVVNDADINYSSQKLGDLKPPVQATAKSRSDIVYLEAWITEVKADPNNKDDPLNNPMDLKIETCVRHKLEWQVKVAEAGEKPARDQYLHRTLLAIINRTGPTITADQIVDKRTKIGTLARAAITDGAGNLNISGRLSASSLNVNGPNANLGIGVSPEAVKRTLHVEGFEIHVGNANGGYGGYSFANRNAPNDGKFIDAGGDAKGFGQRWVWYSLDRIARLWSGADKFWVDYDGNVSAMGKIQASSLNVNGPITFNGNLNQKITGEVRADNTNAVVLRGHWDELEVKGRVIDWTGSNLHIGYLNDHSKDGIYIGAYKGRVRLVEINHAAQKGATEASRVGLGLDSADVDVNNSPSGGGVIYGHDMNHSIFLRIGQDGVLNVTDYHQYGTHRFFTGGPIEAQKERLRIDDKGVVNVGMDTKLRGQDRLNLIKFGDGSDGSDYQILHKKAEASGIAGDPKVPYFRRNTLALHCSAADAFGVYSTNWTPLLEIEGGTGNTIIRGYLGIGVSPEAVKRVLHVEGSEIHSGCANGGNAGFSFANRNPPNNGKYIEAGGDATKGFGQRWVWYSWDRIARLWSGNDKFWVDANGNVTAVGTFTPGGSDIRFKTNIVSIADALSKLEKIRGVYFDWNDLYKSLGGSIDRKNIGLIAQEVEAVFPEVVTDWGDKGYKGIDYSRFIGVLVEAIKELNGIVKDLTDKIRVLEKAKSIK